MYFDICFFLDRRWAISMLVFVFVFSRCESRALCGVGCLSIVRYTTVVVYGMRIVITVPFMVIDFFICFLFNNKSI